MENISNVLFRRNSEVEAKGTITNQATEKAFIGKVNDFFTGNVNYLITACLIYFTIFSGFTNMKIQQIAVLVPMAAIWTVLQANTLIGTMVVGTTVLALAKAYFAFQGASADKSGRDSAQGSISKGISLAVQAVKGNSAELSSEAIQLAQDHIVSSRKSVRTQPPSLEEGVQKFLPTQTATKEAKKIFEGINPEQIVPPTSHIAKSITLAKGLVEQGKDSCGLLQAPQLPQMTAVFEGWEKALGQLRESNQEILSVMTKKQFISYEQICKEVKIKFPNVNPGDKFVQEFFEEQCKSKGLPWGKIGAAVGGVLVTALVGWGAYKVWEYLNALEEDEGHMHTHENTLIVDEDKQIRVSSPTRKGSSHDLKLFKKEALAPCFPKGYPVWVDKGYTSLHSLLSDQVEVYLPKPKKKEEETPLAQSEILNSKAISSLRMPVEHSIGGMKRYGCIRSQI